MEKLTLRECQAHLKKLQEICICQVCQGPLRSPDLVVCFNGHAVCSSCKIKTPKCGMCQTQFSLNKPTILCQMIESLPRVCRYNYSCNYLIKENDDHESWCRYRFVKCIFCSTSVECHVYTKHVSDTHKATLVKMSDKKDIERKKFLIQNTPVINTGVVKLLNQEIFNIVYFDSTTEKSLKVYVIFFPLKKIQNNTFNFFLEIKSTDNKANITVSKEAHISANVRTNIFNVGYPILESFRDKDVIFKTVVSDLQVDNTDSSPSPSKKLKK